MSYSITRREREEKGITINFSYPILAMLIIGPVSGFINGGIKGGLALLVPAIILIILSIVGLIPPAHAGSGIKLGGTAETMNTAIPILLLIASLFITLITKRT